MVLGLKKDWFIEGRPRHLVLSDFESGTPRWCPGCGDHAALTAVQRLARDEGIPPEKAVVVSGIGCSSRFPHYMRAYGVHGLHGRPLPIAEGVVARRPDLHVFVVTGDGDCCAIGTAHWIHSIRYNMKMTVMLFDNNIYGLTKMQTSPTTPKGLHSNTHPLGALLEPLNPLSVTLGVTNASFVAQTVDWNPSHLLRVLALAHKHEGLGFVRILQRCPHYMDHNWDTLKDDPTNLLSLTHEDGIVGDTMLERMYPNHAEHDPSNLARARELADRKDVFPIGILYRNEHLERYDHDAQRGLDMTTEQRLDALEKELDRFAI